MSSIDSHRKIALVIGNGNYQEGVSLRNTNYDAIQMALALKKIGFLIHDNEPKLNLTYQQMRHTITNFECSLEEGDMVLFYFAGHGTQWEDQNYLIPIDNYIEKTKDGVKSKCSLSGPELGTRAINAQNLLNNISDRYPFVTIEQSNRPHGLKPMHAKAGSLVAFACAPGTTADDGNNGEKNGLFTKHLLKYIQTPNEDIQMILRRVTDGVMEDSKEEQIPHLTVALRRDHICLYSTKQETFVSFIKQQLSSVLREKMSTLTLDGSRTQRYSRSQFKRDGKVAAGGNGYGKDLDQICSPHGICVDEMKNIFIVDWGSHRIVRWKWSEKKGEIIPGGNTSGDPKCQLKMPSDLIVDEQDYSIIVADWGNRRIVRFFNQKQEILIEKVYCFGLAMDNQGSLYVSDWDMHEVRRWNIKEKKKEGVIVAGGNGKGNQSNQLNNPSFIFVDGEQSIYVSDRENHRVMKWKKGAQEGNLVAGGNGKGDNLNQLSSPRGLFVDQWKQIYVADSDNHRIMRWCEGDAEGSIVVGGKGQGSQLNQLHSPYGLAFDSEGNIYVADHGNDRVVQYEKIT
ncbi:unnamed protein product [Adineta ricciae]|uniref:Caspase family p20 domain-containing protein n=1 Tax=Adineta ricciae TaxID=249248 RepID=A0A815UHQ3_ADIRI|nr:unnamed protein product [Adineta ricciae]